jgi:hypothetical protein
LNIEVRYPAIFIYKKRQSGAMPHFDIRNSLIDIQNDIFNFSLFAAPIKALNIALLVAAHPGYDDSQSTSPHKFGS